MKIEFCPIILLAFVLAGCQDSGADARAPAVGAPSAPSITSLDTPHLRIATSSDPALSAEAGASAEALFSAYVDLFGLAAAAPGEARHQLRIYATREEFKANNRSRPWAEAYYVSGVSHAYLDPSEPNPYHWLLHEVVHQLNREWTGFAKEKWLNEGLAAYLGSSRYTDGRLETGVPDPNAYPVWWLSRWKLSGDWSTDLAVQQVIPLRALITGQGGPPMDETVNAHYVGWWSLTHFLRHHEGGRHEAGWHRLVRDGGSLADFEREIGPLSEIEPQWYAYLQDLFSRYGSAAGDSR